MIVHDCPTGFDDTGQVLYECLMSRVGDISVQVFLVVEVAREANGELTSAAEIPARCAILHLGQSRQV